MVLTDLSLQEGSHLCKFRLTLILQSFDKVGHLLVLVLCDTQLLSQLLSDLLSSLLLLVQVVELDEQILQLGIVVVILQL